MNDSFGRPNKQYPKSWEMYANVAPTDDFGRLATILRDELKKAIDGAVNDIIADVKSNKASSAGQPTNNHAIGYGFGGSGGYHPPELLTVDLSNLPKE